MADRARGAARLLPLYGIVLTDLITRNRVRGGALLQGRFFGRPAPRQTLGFCAKGCATRSRATTGAGANAAPRERPAAEESGASVDHVRHDRVDEVSVRTGLGRRERRLERV
jgi:hypothetical protein